ncbi:uncharacterized protein LOC114747319 [Neltuma alba]|uniref:uncharacterized protein LOC114747319 n=1 Tax=Neltuma alba TaxID=207710 RepID=UPI0010A2DBF9|nr:uncharacterized protein LOC114747319 [Prosopis alba]
MGGNNRQRKSSSGFMSVFNVFKSKKNRGSHISALFLILKTVCGCVNLKQAAMGGNNRQRKSSSGFMSVFNMFKSKKNRGGHYDSYDDGMTARKVWPSDQDGGPWGFADPGIDIKAETIIARHKRRVSESERFEIDPTAADAQ